MLYNDLFLFSMISWSFDIWKVTVWYLAFPLFCNLFSTIEAAQLTMLLDAEFSQLASAKFGLR